MNKNFLNKVTSSMLPLGIGIVSATPAGAYIGPSSYAQNRKNSIYQSQINHSAPVFLEQKFLKASSNYQQMGQISQSLLPENLVLKKLSNTHNSKSSFRLLEKHSHRKLKSNSQSPVQVSAKQSINEIVIIDAAIIDKSAFYKKTKPGVEIIELIFNEKALVQLNETLLGYQDLNAIHLVTHADSGVIYLGKNKITESVLRENVYALDSIKSALKPTGDLLLYGCELASGQKGEALLDLISRETQRDVAASDNLTGHEHLQGDWELEIKRGVIESELPFSERALQDFSSVLAASDGTKTFTGWSGNGTLTLATTDFNLTGSDDSGAETLTIYSSSVYMTDPGSATGASFFLQADGTNTYSFELTGLQMSEYGIDRSMTNVYIMGYVAGGGTITSSTLSGTGGVDTFTFGAGQLGSFSGLQITGFKVFFDTNQVDYSQIDSFTISGALDPNSAPSIANLNGDSFTFNEGTGAQVVDQGIALTLTDSDSSDFNGGNLTLTITSGEDAGEDVLSVDTSGAVSLSGTTASSNVSVSGTAVGTLANNISAGNDFVVNLNSNATPARMQTLARSLTYENTDGDNPTTGARNVRLTVNDGDGATSSNQDVTITVAAMNDAPSFNNFNGDSFTFSQGDSATNLDQGTAVSFNDVDSSDFNTGNLRVTITSGEDAAEDLLSVDGTVTLGGSTAGSSVTVGGFVIGTLGNSVAEGNDFIVNFGANATPSRVETLIRALTYENTDGVSATAGARNVRVTVNDGDGGTSSNQDLTVTVSVPDSDGTLTAAGGVSEPVGLDTTIDSAVEAVDVFDFTLSDGGTADGAAMSVSQVVVNVSGTSSDTQRSNITWRLDGPDATDVTGVYNGGGNTITFSGLSLSIADGGSEVYTVNAYFNDNTGVTEDATFILSVDGDTDLTVGGGGTQMAATSAVNNGAGGTLDVTATALAFTTQPAGSVSGSNLTTQPVVAARDAFGNTDVDFTETITLTEASAGTLTGTSVAATSGVATFTAVNYSATADQQSFTLTADDQSGLGSDLPTVDANAVTSDVVATQLAFTTQPAPLEVVSGSATNFTTVPVVVARDASGVVDTGYSTSIVISEVNGAGSATMTGTGDADGSSATVTLSPSSGVATFTGMQITYTNSGGSNENFNLRATSGGLTLADSSQLTGLVPDSDGDLTSAASVSEPIALNWSIDTVGEAVNLFDFTLSDGGTSDGLPMTVSQVVINVSGSSSDADRAKITWRLNSNAPNNDVNNVTGVYNAGANTITFSGLSISIADGTSEVLTVNGYYNDNTGLTNGDAIILSVDGDTDLTLGGSNTQMGATSATTNGSGTLLSDDIAPVVTSVSVPANATYGTGQNLDFTVNFDESITVNTGGGTPRLTLTIGATTRYASYVSGSGTSALVFRNTVVAGDEDSNGISISATLDSNSGTLQDSAGNNINTTLNSVGSLASVLVDAQAPTVAEVTAVVTPDTDTTPNVTFSTNEAGTLAIGGSCGSASEGAISAGNNTIALTQPDNSTALAAGTYSNCTVTVTDASGNANTPVTLSSFTIDLTAPTVSEITAVVTPDNDSTPSVTFSTNEAGTLAIGGSCGSASEGAIGSGNNTINLTQTDNTTALAAGTYSDCTVTVTDTAGNASTPVTLTSFTIDLTAPNLAEVTPVSTPGSDTTPDVTFSTNEAGTLAVGGSCGSASEGAIGSGNNTITLTQIDNASALAAGTYSDCTLTVTDASGNSNTPLTLSSFTIDLTAPSVAEVTAVVTPNNDTTPNVTFSTNEAGTLAIGGSCGSASEGAISAGNNTIALTQPDNATALVSGTYSDCTATVTDGVGNASNVLTFSSFVIDATAPTISNNLGKSLNEAESGIIVASSDLTSADNLSGATNVTYTLVSTTSNGVLRNNGSALSNGGTFTQSNINSNQLTYDHDGGETTSDVFTFTLTDQLGNSDNNGGANFSFSFTIAPVNDQPQVTNDSISTNEDNAVVINLLANDSDVDGTLNPASVVIVSAASNGSTSINTGTGAVTYTPNSNFNGSDSFTYTVEDNDGLVSSAATVSVTVNAVNDSPVAVADTATTPLNTLVSIAVSANDTDIDSGDSPDASSIVIVSGASNGTAVFNSGTNEIDYTPNAGYLGADSFTYTIDDSTGATSNTATVSITVFDPNTPPTAVNDSATTDEDTAVAIDILSNDSDSDGTLAANSVTVTTNPSNGTLSVNATTGVTTYTPNADFNGSDSFSYTVDDDDAESSNIASVSITVNAVNDVPIASAQSISTVQATPSAITLSASDVESVNLNYSIVDQPANGTLTGVAPNVTYTPSAEFSGSDSFTFIANDGTDDSLPATISISVLGDLDGDGDPDVTDPDDDGDGIPDSTEGTGDTDGDGIPNDRDTDSDGDGVLDEDEGTVDSDGDGTPDYLDSSIDEDNDGIPDIVEGTIDSDNDGLANFEDLDSDNDGLLDSMESEVIGVDSDDDGIDDAYDVDLTGGDDANGDGIDDNVVALDSDSDSIADRHDLDSDNDGVPDVIEAFLREVDSDSDGIVDQVDVDQTGGVDSDGDGIDDAFDVSVSEGLDADLDGVDDKLLPQSDRNNNGIADYLDLDSDGDGISDSAESGVTGLDSDNDGIDDRFDIDSTFGVDINNDGIDDDVSVVDTDSDGVPDLHDLDSDNDSLYDTIEAGVSDGNLDALADVEGNLIEIPVDTDGDSLADFRDTDSNDDSVDDIDGTDASSLDTDDDGRVDLTVDADGDGIDDSFDTLITEHGAAPIDYDQDGDGIADVTEGLTDFDADGVNNALDRDSDNDGLSDAFEADRPMPLNLDSDFDGIDDAYDVDATGGVDVNADGVDDLFVQVDTDSDGQPDYLDTDSDNDGITDAEEQVLVALLGVDSDGNGIDDAVDVGLTGGVDTNFDGIDDMLLNQVDFDSDGMPNFRDSDSDGDGIPDSLEGTQDADNDGAPNYLDLDADGDGVADSVEGISDTDNDGVADYLDTDSDNDGIADGAENGDFNNDGINDRLQVAPAVITSIGGSGSSSFILVTMMLGILFYRHRKAIAPAALVLISMTSTSVKASEDCQGLQAISESKCWYGGAGLSQSKLKPNVTATGWRLEEDNDLAFNLSAGFSFSENFFSEVRYEELGAAKLVNLNPSITDQVKINYSAFNVNIGYLVYEKNTEWNFYAKAGFSVLNTDSNILLEEERSTQLSLAGGVEWHFSQAWFARFEIISYSEDASSLGVAIYKSWGQ